MKRVFNEIIQFFSNDKYMGLGIFIAVAAFILPRMILVPHTVIVLLFLIAYTLIGHDILMATLRNTRKGQIFDENFLMVIASIGAFILGYYSEAVAVLLFYKAGEHMQDQASDHATRSIQSMLEVRPESANVLANGKIKSTPAQDVLVDSIIRIMPGEKVPLDGIITEGDSDMNTAALTGEAAPRPVSAGNEVLAGFVNGGGLLTVKTTKEFGETVFSKVIKMVKDSHTQKASTEKFITRFARYYTPAVVVLAVLVAVIPPLVTDGAAYSTWIYRALVFLVISCPCALLLSVPLSFFAGIGASAKKGIFVKGGQYLEALAHTTTMVFDKTGTLTTGEFEIRAINRTANKNEDEILRYAAIAEQYSNHPIARCIVNAYKLKGDLPEISYDDYKEIPGHGVTVKAGSDEIMVGKNTFMGIEGLDNRNTYVKLNGVVIGSITVMDKVRDNAAKSLKELRGFGVKKLIMLSGDHTAAVSATAKALNFNAYSAELLPADKLDKLIEVLENQSKDEKTAFVGDGINDAPSLARSDVGIAMGGAGTDAALEASDIVLMQDDLTRLPLAFKIAHRTRTIAYQNIIGAIGAKVIIMIIGTLGYAPLWLAIFADVGVAMLAVLNSLRVLKVK